jgi:purine-binding chemotaxis protein CheW
VTSDGRRTVQFDQLVQAQDTHLAEQQGRVRDLANMAMLPLQALNEGVTGQTKVADEQYLVFWLNEREFAVKAELVQSVERPAQVTPVPNVASWIMGVMNLRGAIVSVVDLKAFFNLEPSSISTRTRFLALHRNEMMISFIVDGVNEMLAITPETIISGRASQTTIPQWFVPYASGSIVLQDRIIVLLDVERLLFSDKIQHF